MASRLGFYLVPLAFGNALGPLVLGPLFDRVDHNHKPMIALTYGTTGTLLIIGGFFFYSGYCQFRRLRVRALSFLRL